MDTKSLTEVPVVWRDSVQLVSVLPVQDHDQELQVGELVGYPVLVPVVV